jgi:hypothetical protein
MKGVYREKLFYGIQHLENFLVPHRAVPDLQRMKRPFSDAIFFYIWRPSRMFYALVSIQRRSSRREADQESVPWTLDCFGAKRRLAMTD